MPGTSPLLLFGSLWVPLLLVSCLGSLANRVYEIDVQQDSEGIRFGAELPSERCAEGVLVLDFGVARDDCTADCDRWFVARSERPAAGSATIPLPIPYGAELQETPTRQEPMVLSPGTYTVGGTLGCYIGRELWAETFAGRFEIPRR